MNNETPTTEGVTMNTESAVYVVVSKSDVEFFEDYLEAYNNAVAVGGQVVDFNTNKVLF